MPVLRLDDQAKIELANFRWPGNIRQLKNITEQISVIEQNRSINFEIIQAYLPIESSALPVVYNDGNVDEKTFQSEREILYKILYDMKNEVSDLKKVVANLEAGHSSSGTSFIQKQEVSERVELIENENIQRTQTLGFSPEAIQNAEDTEEFVEESLSIEEKEKELIIKALNKHKGKRKLASEDLGISERTLYRKIKEYHLE